MCFTALPLPSAVQTVYVNNALSDSAKMSQIGKSGVHAMGSCYAGWLNKAGDWFQSGGAVEFVKAGPEK